MDQSAMTCRESTENLLAQVRSELSPAEQGRLGSHVAGCSACQQEEAEIRLLAGLLADHTPRLQPRADAWNDLREKIDAQAVATGPGRGRLLFGLLAAAATAAGLLLFLLPSHDPLGPSDLTTLHGQVTVDGRAQPIGETVDIEIGRALVAASLSRVTIASKRMVDLVLAPGTRMEVSRRDRLWIHSGKVLVEVLPGEGILEFLFPGGRVEVTGTLFQLEVQGQATTLTVIRGEVTMRTGDEPVRVVSGQSMTFIRGGAPSAPAKADPWRVREWCSAPTLLLEAAPDRITITLRNDTVLPVVVMPFDPAVAAYSLRIEAAAGTLAEMKVQEVMVTEGARRPGDPDQLELEPGESYELALDPKKLGLSPGAYRVTAVYHPYDLPEDAWRGTRETEPRPLTIE